MKAMKKFFAFFAAAAALLAVASSCNKNDDLSTDGVKVNIRVGDLAPGSKAVKNGWELADVIHVYLDDADTYTPDFDLTYDGTKWTASSISAAVEARLKTSGGYLRGFWEGSNYCMTGSTWNRYSSYLEFPASDKQSTTGIIQYLVADFSSIAYTFDGSTLTASINSWRFRTDFQVVVTGLSFSPGNYTLYSDDVDNCNLIDVHSGSAPYECWVSYNSSGSADGRIGAIANDDGIAFVGGLKANFSAGKTITLYLIDQSTSTTYTYSKVLTSSLPSDGTLHAVKIPFSSFSAI